MVGVGGVFILGGGYLPETLPQVFGAASVLLAFVNVAGGFVITKRMLDMFKSRLPAKSGFAIMLTDLKDQLTHLSIPGFTRSLEPCSAVDF
jgi:NAD/NADP transhydrogenase alpha subunit